LTLVRTKEALARWLRALSEGEEATIRSDFSCGAFRYVKRIEKGALIDRSYIPRFGAMAAMSIWAASFRFMILCFKNQLVR
jgi:hypothetical protein